LRTKSRVANHRKYKLLKGNSAYFTFYLMDG
jgi:hypothetical protein